eukprot:gnl/Spiro4/2234_TR1079_c0_g1_i1.p1 gnl/Spiro4/2234_TR1079_c0_g1~~gnl/Spiro4/2234_TR1079_c0_g1_i1.p1  ORF type:complete len:313 (+),score=60.98 gnl/Spiro4/2234_TR1079_c0_g1_i1:57-941(+)
MNELRTRDSELCLEVEVTVPGHVPASLTLLCVSDTHDFQHRMPRPLPHADILVHAGDFTVRGSRDEVANFRAWTQQLLDEGIVGHVVFVAGNHDFSLDTDATKNPRVLESQLELKRALTQRERVHYLQDGGCTVLGLRFYGTPWTTRFSRWAFQAPDTEEGLGRHFARIPVDGSVDVLVSHSPPRGQGDSGHGDSAPFDFLPEALAATADSQSSAPPPAAAADDGTHEARMGSRVLLQRVLQAKPLLHVFGHIHTGHGVTTLADCRTVFVNCAICNEDYEPLQRPILVRLVHPV